MREPAFWYRPSSLAAAALWPLSKIYGAVAASRMAQPGLDPGVPVICVGNLNLGGAGKTPTVLALVAMLLRAGETPVVLSRGYGGRLRGPVLVDAARHGAADVGDEPLMMAAQVPVVVARDRVEGAVLCRARGASVIVMDDGFQNPSLVKHLSLVVVDAARGIGNGCVVPAGPLRAPLDVQLARIDAIVVIGEGAAAEAIVARAGKPVFRARLLPEPASVAALGGRRLLAFAGIGHPEKFFLSLRAAGLDVAEARSFADHHVYSDGDLAALRADAKQRSLTLVTTQKDLARLGDRADGIAAFTVTLDFDDEARAIWNAIGGGVERARQSRRSA